MKCDLIVAREYDLARIEKEFDTVLKGEFGISVITENAGTGKTFLVNNCVDFFLNNESLFINIKFKQYSDTILFSMMELVEKIIVYILSLEKEQFEIISKSYKKYFKLDKDLIVSLFNEAEKIFGERTKINYALKNDQIVDIIVKFIDFSSEIFFPLVIFLMMYNGLIM